MVMPAKSAQQHWLTGSRSQAKPEPGASKFSGRARPKMPKYLSSEEQEIWRGIVRLLSARGTLSAAEAPQIEIYAQTKARHLALLRELKQYGEMVDTVVFDSEGKPYTKRAANPASKLATSLVGQLRGQLKELCATISSRENAARVTPPKPKKDSEKTREELETEAGEALLNRRLAP